MDPTYLPAIIVLTVVIVPCIWLFWKWAREDAGGKKTKLKKNAKGITPSAGGYRDTEEIGGGSLQGNSVVERNMGTIQKGGV